MNEPLITVGQYLNKGKVFEIPNYQRGYVWGKNKSGSTDSATYLMQSLLNGFKSNAEIFLQGITVCEQEETIIVIDGQQRTTMLYLIMCYLSKSENFKMHYAIRTVSNDFLNNLKTKTKDELEMVSEDDSDDFQDIYYFKKSMRIITSTLKEVEDKEKILNYIINKVRFIYINIDLKDAVSVFSMMNGNKAQMKPEEIIKAEMLRLVSLNTESDSDLEWEANMLRSRYAREWDNWLHWWRQSGVIEWIKGFSENDALGLLVSSFYRKKPEDNLTYEGFNEHLRSPKKAKETFDKLRRIQRRFEDAYNNPIVYNQIGAIVRLSRPEDKFEFIRHYFVEAEEIDLDNYYKKVFVSMTYKEIIDNNEDKFKEKFNEKLDALNDDFLYFNSSEEAFRLLLRLNIDEDCKQKDGEGRKFDFDVWDRGPGNEVKRSLEHIHPKSKVYSVNGSGEYVNCAGAELPADPTLDSRFISRKSIVYRIENAGAEDGGISIETTEHSIGNLVLLDKNDNSKFNDKPFDKKKNIFFKPDIDSENTFKSRHLLHTIYTFAESTWNGEQIAKNKHRVIEQFKSYYDEK